MAKKPSRSGRPQPGGRVTPKGVRPAGDTSRHDQTARPGFDAQAAPDPKPNPASGRPQPSSHAPTRAGHHRGNR
ncbi:MAG: hypothetical protein ACRDZU_07215 [Acidimicrobiales bacterium]